MYRKLTEDDFELLREPLQSGRQSPNSLGGVLLLGIFLQWLMHFVTYYVAGGMTIFPNIQVIEHFHYWSTIVLSFFSFLFLFPFVFNRFEKNQYFLSIVVSQNLFGIYPFLIGVFTIGESATATEGYMINLINQSLAIALILFAVTVIRFYLLLLKGRYQEERNRFELGNRFEILSCIPLVVVAITGMSLIIFHAINLGYSIFSDEFTMISLFFIIFYGMVFVLPEQLVILYCKCRYERFNFNGRSYLPE